MSACTIAVHTCLLGALIKLPLPTLYQFIFYVVLEGLSSPLRLIQRLEVSISFE